ncbi:MAG: hypothetical protein CK424_02855 [Legionella sp.]|nr:MAG: hypothetical protein CK424_02855 [Legionella sp.]
MSTGNTIKKSGQYCMIAGGATLFIMAASATIILDVVFIIAMIKQANEAANSNNRNPAGSGIRLLSTYLLWDLVSNNTHPLILLLLSPLVSIAAAILAVALDVSYVATWIAGGWAAGAALLLLGYGLYKLGQYVNNEQPQLVERPTENSSYISRLMQSCGLFQEKIEMTPWATAEVVDSSNADLSGLPTARAYAV